MDKDICQYMSAYHSRQVPLELKWVLSWPHSNWMDYQENRQSEKCQMQWDWLRLISTPGWHRCILLSLEEESRAKNYPLLEIRHQPFWSRTHIISLLPFEILSTAWSQCSQVPLSLVSNNWGGFIFPGLFASTTQCQLGSNMLAIKLRECQWRLKREVSHRFLFGQNNMFRVQFCSILFICISYCSVSQRKKCNQLYLRNIFFSKCMSTGCYS